jgi:hypothetical protein
VRRLEHGPTRACLHLAVDSAVLPSRSWLTVRRRRLPVRGCAQRRDLPADQGLVGRGSGDDGVLCGEPMTVTNRLRRQARMSEPAAVPEPSALAGATQLIAGFLAFFTTCVPWRHCQMQASFWRCLRSSGAWFQKNFWEMEHFMADALLLIMAVSVGTISFVVAHELAKRNR